MASCVQSIKETLFKKMDAIWDHAEMPSTGAICAAVGFPARTDRTARAVDCSRVAYVGCLSAQRSQSSRPRHSPVDAGEHRQALRESFSVTRAVSRPATPYDDRFLDGRAGACSIARSLNRSERSWRLAARPGS